MPFSHDAVLLIAFGGPASREDIRPFIGRVLQGIPVPPGRIEEVAHHYEAIGGRSPLNEITLRQARALEKILKEMGLSLPVYVGLRQTHLLEYQRNPAAHDRRRREESAWVHPFPAPHGSELGTLSK